MPEGEGDGENASEVCNSRYNEIDCSISWSETVDKMKSAFPFYRSFAYRSFAAHGSNRTLRDALFWTEPNLPTDLEASRERFATVANCLSSTAASRCQDPLGHIVRQGSVSSRTVRQFETVTASLRVAA